MQHQCNLAAKESGLECTCMNNDDSTVLVSGSSRHSWISMCTLWLWIQNEWGKRATNLHQILHYAWTYFGRNDSDDSEGCSCGQMVMGSFIMTMRLLTHHVSRSVFWQNIKSPRWLSPLQYRFGTLQLLAFPKIKITFEREEISDLW